MTNLNEFGLPPDLSALDALLAHIPKPAGIADASGRWLLRNPMLLQWGAGQVRDWMRAAGRGDARERADLAADLAWVDALPGRHVEPTAGLGERRLFLNVGSQPATPWRAQVQPLTQRGLALWLWCFEAESVAGSPGVDPAPLAGGARLLHWRLPLGATQGQWLYGAFPELGLEPGVAPSAHWLISRVHAEDRPQLVQALSLAWSGIAQALPHLRWTLDPVGWLTQMLCLQPERNGAGQVLALRAVLLDPVGASGQGPDAQSEHVWMALASNSLRIGLWSREMATGRSHWNPAMFEMFGYPVGTQPPDSRDVEARLVPRPEASNLMALHNWLRWRDGPHGAIQQSLEAGFLRPDGQMLWFRVAGRRVSAAGGHWIHGIVIDVTESIRQREALAHLDTQTQALLDGLGVGLFRLEPGVQGGTAGHWSPQMALLHGLDPAHPMPSPEAWVAMVHPDDQVLVRRFLRAQGASQAAESIRYRVMTTGGPLRHLLLRLQAQEGSGSPDALLGVALDVTEQQLAADEAEEAQERLRLAARGAGIGFWAYDPTTREVLWDEQMFRLRGFPPRVGHPTLMERHAVLPGDYEATQRIYAAAVRTGEPNQYMLRVRRPDGSLRWIYSSLTARKNLEGRVLALSGINWDVTERIEADAARQKQLLAERESEAKSEFLARASHELRTPLQAVLGFTQMLLQAPEATDVERLQWTHHVHESAQGLLQLINDLLDLSSLQTGRVRLHLRALRLADVVHQVLPGFALQAREHTVSLRCGDLRGQVLADPVRLRQVLSNLISNAIKYNRIGGSVEIAVDQEGEDLLVHVRDSGHGMTPAQRADLFKPFHRLGAERSAVAGTGVGLTLTKSMVEQMHARIEVHSQPGVGSCFTVRWPPATQVSGPLPAPAEGPPPEAPLPESGAAPAAPQPVGRDVALRQVLYLEDNPLSAKVMAYMFRRRPDLTLRVVGSIAEAEQALEPMPALLLIDMNLPDGFGTDALWRLRRAGVPDGVPAVAFSADTTERARNQADRAGFLAYWIKPVLIESLLDGLAQVLPLLDQS